MRVALFFDGNNFYGGWRETAAPTRVEFQALARWLVESVGGTELAGAWYYTGVDKGEPTETVNLESRDRLEGFLTMLEHQPGYFVRRFPRVPRATTCSSCGAEHTFSQEKGVDTTMVADMIRLAAAGAFDAMVLVTGDADHAPGLVAVRELGRRALVATWGGYGLSHWLRAEAWDHVDLLEGLSQFAADPVQLVVVDDPESTASETDDEASSVTEDVTDPTSDPGLHAAFLQELGRAEHHFQSGYVGLALFLHRWTTQSELPHWMRPAILDQLVAQGKVEVYETQDGKMALRRAG